MDLSYLNARIRAWKGELLVVKEAYERLISAENISGLISRLKETHYARDIEAAAARYKNEKDILEGAFKGNLVRTFKELWNYAPSDAKGFLKAIFSIWEAYNLKTIIRARAKGISPDMSMAMLMPAGEMDESALKELNLQKDVFEIANLLSTWASPYAKPIKDVVERYKRERHPMIIELALDRFVHNYSLSIAKRKLSEGINRRIIEWFVRERINSINISTLLKLSGEGAASQNAGDYFLEKGGLIDREGFLKLAGILDKKKLLQELSNLTKDSRLKDIIISADPEEAFFLEEKIEELLMQRVCRIAIIEPLSIALAICFIYKKIKETKNLRLILRMKIFNIPAIEVKRLII